MSVGLNVDYRADVGNPAAKLSLCSKKNTYLYILKYGRPYSCVFTYIYLILSYIYIPIYDSNIAIPIPTWVYLHISIK